MFSVIETRIKYAYTAKNCVSLRYFSFPVYRKLNFCEKSRKNGEKKIV